jgi:hypothetical protein
MPIRILFAALGLTVCASATGAPVAMAVEEHFSLAAGNTEVGKNDNGSDFAVFMTQDGKRKLRVTTPDGRVSFEDEGYLFIESGTYCSQWKKMNQGRRVCGIKVFRDGDAFRSLRPDGSGSLHRFEPGNSRGL